MVADVVEEDLTRLAVLLALEQRADAGLAGVVRRQRGRVGQHGLDQLQRHHLLSGIELHGLLGEQAQRLQHREDVDVVFTEAHPEADGGDLQDLRQRVDLVVAGEVGALRAHDRQIVGAAYLEHLVGDPLSLLPGPGLTGELAEVDLGVEVGGEVAAVAAGIHVDDVERVDTIEPALLRQRRIGVDDTRIEADAEDGRDAFLLALVTVLPFIVGIPGRLLADLGRIFVDGRVEVGGAGVEAGAQHRHVDEGRAHIDDDVDVVLADERPGGVDVQRIQRVCFEDARFLQAAPGMDAVDDLLALGRIAGSQVDGTKLAVVLGALVGHHMTDSTSANDQDIFLHARMTPRVEGVVKPDHPARGMPAAVRGDCRIRTGCRGSLRSRSGAASRCGHQAF